MPRVVCQGGLQETLEVGNERNLPRPLAYTDNTLLQGTPHPMATMRPYQALVAFAISLGLHAQPVKCTIHSEDAASATSIAGHL
jgi:hypothetical protein